jgi:precorrin-2 methylase
MRRGACPQIETKALLEIPMPKTPDENKLQEYHDKAAETVSRNLKKERISYF